MLPWCLLSAACLRSQLNGQGMIIFSAPRTTHCPELPSNKRRAFRLSALSTSYIQLPTPHFASYKCLPSEQRAANQAAGR